MADPIFPAYGNPDIDVLHYGLKLDWNPARRELTGTARLMVRAVKRLDAIALDFGRPLTVDAVTVAGEPATSRHPGNDLVVRPATPLAAGAEAEVVVRYHGKPKAVRTKQHRSDLRQVGLRAAADGSAWALQEPYGAFTWFPVNDLPSDEALYDVAITVPKGWSAVAHGAYAGRDGNTFRWRSTHPVASYVTLFTVDRYRKFTGKGPRGLPLTYWVRKEDQAGLLPTLRKTPAILRWLEKRLGPYPFPSAGVVVTSETGMETQQMVTLSPEFLRPGIIAHEMAHQWFGNAVTPRTWRDLWLNEGFAMYFEWLWVSEHEWTSMEDTLAWARGRDKKLRKVSGPPGHYKRDRFADSNVYYGPALMLHEIRTRLGDERFFATMRAWAQEHRDTTQDRASFTTWLNTNTGEDFTSLIAAWLDSPTTPASTPS